MSFLIVFFLFPYYKNISVPEYKTSLLARRSKVLILYFNESTVDLQCRANFCYTSWLSSVIHFLSSPILHLFWSQYNLYHNIDFLWIVSHFLVSQDQKSIQVSFLLFLLCLKLVLVIFKDANLWTTCTRFRLGMLVKDMGPKFLTQFMMR